MEWRPGNATPVGCLLPHYPISGGEENFSEAPPIIRPSYPLIFGLSHCMPLVRNWVYPCGTEYTSRPVFSSRKSVWKFTSSVDCLQASAETPRVYLRCPSGNCLRSLCNCSSTHCAQRQWQTKAREAPDAWNSQPVETPRPVSVALSEATVVSQ